jgi:N6-adenosine-specific RNA methylase IME4
MLTDWRDRVQQETERVTVNLLRVGRRRRSGGPALPVGVYRLLYVDPPWQYEHIATESRAIENQYPTMDLDAIKALDVPAADDAVLFLWATSPKLAEAMEVIRAWDFDYRTSAAWDKELIGMGYYFRQQHELLLVAARGTLPVPAPSDRVSSVIRARREAHSQKPKIVYEVLEAMYPTFGELDRVELFQREPRPGWSGWGNESVGAHANG